MIATTNQPVMVSHKGCLYSPKMLFFFTAKSINPNEIGRINPLIVPAQIKITIGLPYNTKMKVDIKMNTTI